MFLSLFLPPFPSQKILKKLKKKEKKFQKVDKQVSLRMQIKKIKSF